MEHHGKKVSFSISHQNIDFMHPLAPDRSPMFNIVKILNFSAGL